MPETVVTTVQPAPATEPSTVVSSSTDLPSLKSILEAEFKQAEETEKTKTSLGESSPSSLETTQKETQEKTPPQQPKASEARQEPDSPYGPLKPEYLGQLEAHYKKQAEQQARALQAQQHTQQQTQPTQTSQYADILRMYGIGGEYRDEKELISRLAAGYASEAREKQQMAAAIQHLTAQARQQAAATPELPKKPDLGELSWTEGYDPSWDTLVVEDPTTGQAAYRPDTTPEQQRAYETWMKQRENTWRKWMNNPQSMAKDISKFIDQEVVRKTAEEVARNQIQQVTQLNKQEEFLKNYMTRNMDVFFENRGGQQAPSPWAGRVHQLLLSREQGGWGLPLTEAIAQFEREYALNHMMSRQYAPQQPLMQQQLPNQLPTGVPNLTLEQAAATATANKVMNPGAKNEVGRASLGEIFKDQLVRAGIFT